MIAQLILPGKNYSPKINRVKLHFGRIQPFYVIPN